MTGYGFSIDVPCLVAEADSVLHPGQRVGLALQLDMFDEVDGRWPRLKVRLLREAIERADPMVDPADIEWWIEQRPVNVDVRAS